MSRLTLIWLAAAVAIPVALHIWTRSRPLRLNWAAWRFLPIPEPADERIVRIEHPWLLALRALALLLLTYAAAGPTCQRQQANDDRLTGVSQPRFLIDVSAGMGAGDLGERPLDRAAELLDDWWRQQHWPRGEVYACRGGSPQLLYTASQNLPRRFLGLIEDQWRLGASALVDCMQKLSSSEFDLIVFSDVAAPEVGWQGFRSAQWIGVAPESPRENSGFGDVDIEFKGNLVRVSGNVIGPAAGDVELSWRTPQRPEARTPIVDGAFRFELLVPREDGRAILQLPGGDAAPWDNVLPVWLPAGGRPEVKLLGNFSPSDERLLLDLLYAASDRINLDFGDTLAPNRPGKRIYILDSPASLSGEDSAAAYLDVVGGSIAIVFPAASERAASQAQKWAPGWLHPSQPLKNQAVKPGGALPLYWPELDGLDWPSVRVSHVFPLADPDPQTSVLVETAQGLPILVRHPVGSGIVYNWTIDLDATASNLPLTALWVPLWLAMMESLTEQIGGAEQIDADTIAQTNLREVDRVDTAYRAPRGSGSLNWLKARKNQEAVLVSERIAATEVSLGNFSARTVLSRAADVAEQIDVGSEPTDLLWLLAAAVAWLGQAVVGQRLALVLLALLAGLTPKPAVALEQSELLRIWIPNESAANPAQISGIRLAIEEWRVRASPEVVPQPVSFSWSTTAPSDPWVWWAGCKRFDPLADSRLAAAARQFIRTGGTLWIDACGGPAETRRYAAKLGEWFQALGMGEDWRELDADHVIWRTFYLLSRWHDPEENTAIYGLQVDGLERVFLVPNLARSLSRDALGGWVLPLTEESKEWQLRQGLNLLMYATTYDYKNDSIHLPYILERRRRHR